MLWVETQSTFVIGILVFGFCYLLATVTLCGALMFSRLAVAPSLTRVSEVMMSLVVILGLLIGFLAARVWENVDRANKLVGQEAGALRQIVLLAGSLPPDLRASVRQAVQRHIHLIESEEWPAMARGRATLGSIAEGLAEAMTVLLSFNPEQFNQQL